MFIFRITSNLIEVQGERLPPESAGAYVNIYVRGENLVNAITAAEQYFADDGFSVVMSTIAAMIDEEDFDDEQIEEGDPGKTELMDILENGGYWYGTFHSYPVDKSLH